MTTVPEHLRELLERPLFGALGTVRPDNTVQVNPMWFEWDGETIQFTHSTKRAKYRNLQRNPSMALTVFNPDRPTHHIEVRGQLVSATPDPTGAFYQRLAARYGKPGTAAPADSPDRVILTMSIDYVGGHKPGTG